MINFVRNKKWLNKLVTKQLTNKLFGLRNNIKLIIKTNWLAT